MRTINMSRSLIRFQDLHHAPLVLLRLLAALLVTLVATASSLRADVTIKFDDLKDGDKISDVAVVIVRADSGDGIDKVEFAVDDQLRFSSGSTPYTFKWDTIADTEGAHNLAVTAIDANGVKKTVRLSLVVDNELALGAPALAQKAREALLAKDLDTATKYSRRALKAEPDNIEASRALAAILADKLSWDTAITSLEKAKNITNSAPAMLELAGYHMHRAVLPENVGRLVADFESASQLRRKAADLNIESLKARNLPGDAPQTHETLGDAYVNAGRYLEAIQEYSKSASSGSLTSVNRLALAYVLNEQAKEGTVLLRSLIKDKTADAGTRAVMGLALLRLRRFTEARDAVHADGGTGGPASLVVASFADAVLAKTPAAVQEAKDAVEARPMAGEAHYALSMSLSRLVESEPEVVKALALSPFQSGPLVDYAVRYAMLAEHPDRFETALKLLDIVLTNEPANASAKLAKVLLLLHLKRLTDAEPILSELDRHDAQSADVQIAAAIYFELKDKPTASEERLKKARGIDKDFFDLGTAPKPLEFLYTSVRKIHYRGGFYLSPETLYPQKTTVAAQQ
jgi:tetratricopeptide (TPR) repeat protein